MKKTAYIALTLIFNKEEDGRWSAICEELGTATYANSPEQAEEEIVEMVELHLNALESVGEREHFFEKNKIKLIKGPPEPTVRMKIPTNVGFAKPIIHTFRNTLQVC